jgi:hypothetical protein
MSFNVTFDVTGLLNKLEKGKDVVLEEAYTFVEQASEIGAEEAKNSLDAAITSYGLYRMSRGIGNTAGRNDEGNMISKLTALEPESDGNTVEGSFGWTEQDFEEYFEYQEEGTSRIPAAYSLLDGLEQVEAQLPRLERNMKQRIRRRMS